MADRQTNAINALFTSTSDMIHIGIRKLNLNIWGGWGVGDGDKNGPTDILNIFAVYIISAVGNMKPNLIEKNLNDKRVSIQ